MFPSHLQSMNLSTGFFKTCASTGVHQRQVRQICFLLPGWHHLACLLRTYLELYWFVTVGDSSLPSCHSCTSIPSTNRSCHGDRYSRLESILSSTSGANLALRFCQSRTCWIYIWKNLISFIFILTGLACVKFLFLSRNFSKGRSIHVVLPQCAQFFCMN